MHRSIVVVSVLIGIALVVVGGTSLFAPPTTETVDPEAESDGPAIVTPAGFEGGFWPYLNSRESFETRSPINVIIVGASGEEVIALMSQETDAKWNETDHDDVAPGEIVGEGLNETIGERNESVAVGTGVIGNPPSTSEAGDDLETQVRATATAWGSATGTTRYAYLYPSDGSDGVWVTETYQLDDGDYYGTRYHVRLYESPNPDEEWVIMQAHSEHFDWFTLRHAVDGVEEAQSYIEADFMEQPFVAGVWRTYLDNRGPSDADGWATVVELAVVFPLVMGPLAFREALQHRLIDGNRRLTDVDRRRIRAARARYDPRQLLLVVSIIGLYLGVRIVGIALERHAPALTMHMIAGLLFPFVAIGIPLATYLVARGLERRLDSAVVAALSLSLAFVLDYSMLGVDVLPLAIVVHRAGVIVALGLVAGGAARRATRESGLNDMFVAGVGLWVLLLVTTLFGWV